MRRVGFTGFFEEALESMIQLVPAGIEPEQAIE
jgi:hypothetical protein